MLLDWLWFSTSHLPLPWSPYNADVTTPDNSLQDTIQASGSMMLQHQWELQATVTDAFTSFNTWNGAQDVNMVTHHALCRPYWCPHRSTWSIKSGMMKYINKSGVEWLFGHLYVLTQGVLIRKVLEVNHHRTSYNECSLTHWMAVL